MKESEQLRYCPLFSTIINSFDMSVVFVILSIILYILAPEEYDYVFCLYCAILYLVVFIYSVKRDLSDKNYMSFNILFLLFLFITSFITPLFLRTSTIFSDIYINKGTALVTFAAAVYHMGWHRSFYSISSVDDESFVFPIRYRTKSFLNILCAVVILVFIILLFFFMRSLAGQTNDFDVVYFVVILHAFLTLTLIVNVISNSDKCGNFFSFFKENIYILVSTLFVIISFLFIGDRTTPIYLSLMTMGAYSLFVKRIKLPVVLIGFAIASLFMFTIGQTRLSSREGPGNISIMERTQSAVSGTSSVLDYFSDFTPASTSLYMSLSYVETNNKFFYPGKIIITILSPIPFLPSILSQAIFHVPNGELASGYLTTSLYNQKIQTINGGLGTHCVGDIYLSWGVLGVFFAFYLFGRLIGVSQKHSKSNIYWAIVYISLLGNSVYLPRATLFDSYRLIVFQLFIIWLFRQLRI